ncbi:MAG: SAM-dependent methyltransferase [Flavobacteriaceae bacterium]|nr:SAM-dependent methyltransferase [Flavobacteriaceae bacterium]
MLINKGKLYLIPTTLGDNDPMEVLPISVRNTILHLDRFIVENEKTARRFIKNICPEKNQQILKFNLIDKHTDSSLYESYLDECFSGISVGIISEAGVPGIADPGAEIVKIAHRKNIQVVPLVGPSSILLAMMSSGFNGQNFTFNGYLPIDASEKKSKIRFLEKQSKENNQAQIFIETPYRNNKLLDDLINTLNPTTKLCIAADLTLSSEFIQTQSIREWKNKKVDLHKRPAIFIIQQE